MDDSSINSVPNSPALQTGNIVVLKKVKEQAEQQGQALVDLIDQAPSPSPDSHQLNLYA